MPLDLLKASPHGNQDQYQYHFYPLLPGFRAGPFSAVGRAGHFPANGDGGEGSLILNGIPTRHDDKGLLTEPKHKFSYLRVLARVTHTFSEGCPIFHAAMFGSVRSIQSMVAQ